MSISRRVIIPCAVVLLAAFTSCTESTTGPSVGPGDELDATVNGTPLSITLTDLGGFNTYTVSTKQARIGGTVTSGGGTKTVTITFIHDLDNGPFPQTLTGSAVTINYLEQNGGIPVVYDCPIGANSCSVTVTGSNGTIVDGTFSANLADMNDTTKKVTITNGSFSAKLTRQ